MRPDDVKYTKTHEWVRVSDSEATVGITDYAQEELGDIVGVELPDPGAVVQAGEPFGSVDSVKAVSDLISPVSGEVARVNDALLDAPELINESPFADGWIMVVTLSDPSELEGLLTANEYQAFLEQAG